MSRRTTNETNNTPAKRQPRKKAVPDPAPVDEAPPRLSTKPIKAEDSVKIASTTDLPDSRVHYLWQDRIPLGAVTLLAGDQASGKSTFCGMLAGAVTTGKALPDGPINGPAAVLWLGAEEQLAEVVRPRLIAARADLSRVFFPEVLSSGVRRRSSSRSTPQR